MEKVESIIQILQEELILRKKSYFALPQATKILREKGILSKFDFKNGYLKEKIEKGEIPDTMKTTGKPSQWRIIKDKNFKKVKSTKSDTVIINRQKENKSIDYINTERTHRVNEKPVYLLCPYCGINLSLPEMYRENDGIGCYNCKQIFKNPLVYRNDKTVYEKINLHQKSSYSSSNQTKKHLPIGTQIFRGLLAALIIWAFIKGCTETPEEAMRQYQKEQKTIREHEKKNRETKEFFEFMGGQE